MNTSRITETVQEKNLTSTHDHHFGKSKHLFIFRVCCLLWFTSEWIQIIIFIRKADVAISWCSLTWWGLFTTFLYFGLVVFDYIFGYKLKNTCQIFNFTIFTVEMLITIFYWTILWPAWQFFLDWSYPPFDTYGFFTWHTLPFVTLMIDTAWNKHLFNIKHWWIPVCYNLIYAAVNAIWTQTTGQPVYPIAFEWTDWITAASVAFCLALTIGGVLIIYHGKNRWHKKMTKRSTQQNSGIQETINSEM